MPPRLASLTLCRSIQLLARIAHAVPDRKDLEILVLRQVLKDRVGELEAGPLALAVQQLDLHAGPERRHHGVSKAGAGPAHGGHQPRCLGPLAERPRGELDS